MFLRAIIHPRKCLLMQNNKHISCQKAMMYLDMLQVCALIKLESLNVSLQLNKVVQKVMKLY